MAPEVHSDPPTSHRRQARVLALQALCAMDVQGEAFAPHLGSFLQDAMNYADLGWAGRCDPRAVSQARRLCEGAWAFRAQADAMLSQHVTGWAVNRMQPVDRNILRLGLFELMQTPETPPAVVIDEAVALAQVFGGNESPAFVNGVLDGLRRAAASGEGPDAGKRGPIRGDRASDRSNDA